MIDTVEKQHGKQCFRREHFRPSVRWTLVLLNLSLLLLLIVGLVVVSFRESRSFHHEIMREISTSLDDKQKSFSSAILHSLSEQSSHAAKSSDFDYLTHLLTKLANDIDDIDYFLVMNQERTIVSHSRPHEVGKKADSELDRKILEMLVQEFAKNEREPKGLHLSRFIDIPNDNGLVQKREVFHPIYVDGRIWGSLRCRFNLSRLSGELHASQQSWNMKLTRIRIETLGIIGIIFLIGTSISAMVVHYLSKVLKELNVALANIADGNLNFAIPKRKIIFQEFSQLVDSFNIMTRRLRRSHRQLDDYSRNLAHKVEERSRELQAAQVALLKQAHEAGMAEMAVGILHNIGNAITPAKMGNMLLMRRLKSDTLYQDVQEAMQAISESLSAPGSKPPDEQERLIAISKILPDTIKEEHESYHNEIERIHHKLEHIEMIISLQMRYARLYSGFEEVDINSLVHDALKMLEDSIGNRGITVIDRLGKVPAAIIEKGKMMQIVINLLKNSYEAMSENLGRDRVLEIGTSLEQGPPAYVVLSIKDTGVGFADEDRKSLFKFGYTTKSAGSGFGLHSCANYLIANKGQIEAFSEGKGKGARFVVKVPTREAAGAESQKHAQALSTE